jgi:hypothetical protein
LPWPATDSDPGGHLRSSLWSRLRLCPRARIRLGKSGEDHGVTLSWEYSRGSRQAPRAGFWLGAGMSAVRGCGFALGASYSVGIRFGITCGVLSTLGQVIAYQIGIRPDVGYRPATRPRLTRYHLLAAANRASGYALTGYLSSLVAHQREHAIAIRLKAGLVIGVVTTVVGACSPFIEWTADPAPSRRRGIFGVVLLLIGFTLQSVQYRAALPGVAVR